MLPSPAKLHNHNFAKPVNGGHNHGAPKSPRGIPFTKPPSRIVVQQSPTQGPVTSLMLSLPLAQKIHELILTSRRIQSVADGLFSGHLTEEQSANRMDVLVEDYDRLRDSIAGELETAWVAAGFLPAQMPTYPPASNILQAAPDPYDLHPENDAAHNNLKRAWPEEEEEEQKQTKKRTKKRKLEKKASSPSEGWIQPATLAPVGLSKPLKLREKRRLDVWDMRRAWGRGNAKIEPADMSPRGTTFNV